MGARSAALDLIEAAKLGDDTAFESLLQVRMRLLEIFCRARLFGLFAMELCDDRPFRLAADALQHLALFAQGDEQARAPHHVGILDHQPAVAENGEKPKRMSGGRVEVSLLKNDLEQLAGGATTTPQQ